MKPNLVISYLSQEFRTGPGRVFFAIALQVTIVAITLLGSPAVNDATAGVIVHDDRISISEDQRPLVSILKELSEKTKVVVMSGKALSQPVSCNFRNMNLEQSIRNLLKMHDYALIYIKSSDGRIVLQEIRIPGDQSLVPISQSSSLQSSPQPSAEESTLSKKVKQTWYRKRLENRDAILDQVSAVSDQPDGNGVFIDSLPKNSFLAKIGLSEGDVVLNINGIRVNSPGKLIKTLTPPAGITSLGIHGVDSAGRDKAVYIHLENDLPLEQKPQ